MKSDFEITSLESGTRLKADTLGKGLLHWQEQKECFLFISPHDDDAVIGSGLLMQLAVREKVPVYLLVVTDGSMGYCSAEEKESISQIRKEETLDCYQSLGISEENIIWLGFPDCRLNLYRGRHPVSRTIDPPIEGFTGLQNALTYWLRQIRPTRCFLPTHKDLHPDHKIVHTELIISVFHSLAGIWPELGLALEAAPLLYEMAVYCNFSEPPKLRIESDPSYLEQKMNAICDFKSQKSLAPFIDTIRNFGPYEYFRPLEYKLYNPSEYHDMFEKG